MEIRLNMIEVKKNFKGRHGKDVLCRACRILFRRSTREEAKWRLRKNEDKQTSNPDELG